MKIAKWLLGTVLVLVLLYAIGFFVEKKLTWVDIDHSPLAEIAETESYSALFKRLEDNPPGPDGFSFIALGDSRSNFDKASWIFQRAAVEEPAFILSNGDIVLHGTVEEYLDYHMPLVRMIAPIPLIVAPGNHEEGPNDDFSTFKAVYGDVRFSFDYGNSRFIGINNSDFTKLGGDDLRFLRKELSKPGVDHKFVIFHVPPEFLEHAVESKRPRGFTWNAKRFHRLMIEQEVDHVFAGHVHGFASANIDGVQYTITGGAGAGFDGRLGEEGGVYNFVVTHVSPEGVQSEVLKFVDEQWVHETIH